MGDQRRAAPILQLADELTFAEASCPDAILAFSDHRAHPVCCFQPEVGPLQEFGFLYFHWLVQLLNDSQSAYQNKQRTAKDCRAIR